MSRQPVPVRIFHQAYTLMAETDPRETEEIAHHVDELMTSIAERAGTGDATRVAVLACLHLADKLRAAESRLRSFEDKSERIANLLENALERV